jgi:hypothetical protein
MLQVSAEDLLALFQEIAKSVGGGGAPNEGASSVGMGERIDALETKLDDLKSMLEGLTGGGGGGMPGAAPAGDAGVLPGEGDMPPLDQMPAGLESALAGGPPMGGGMDPAMAAGQPTPSLPGGGMGVSASSGNGIQKKAFEVSELVAKLRSKG